MSNRLDKEKEQRLQPERIEYAVNKIESLGFTILNKDETKIQFMYKGHKVTLYPYSGWHSGKSIKDGRGIENLLSQLKS